MEIILSIKMIEKSIYIQFINNLIIKHTNYLVNVFFCH